MTNKKHIGIKAVAIGLALLIALVAFLLYGPWSGFRDFWITSAMTTYSRQWLATGLYSDETIERVMNSNKMVEIEAFTDTSLIDTSNITSDEIEIIKVSGVGFKGSLIKIHDPSMVKLALPEEFNQGEKLYQYYERENAICAINGGGFYDSDGHSAGNTPLGMVMKDGKIISDENYIGHLVGITYDNKLVLGKYEREQIDSLNLRDAIEFLPYLIINGQPSDIKGNGGWGLAPRSAIAQCKDGTFLFLCLDGRSVTSIGASMKAMQDILLEHGAYNAVNLDGGSSSIMMYNSNVISVPCTSATGRYIPNAFVAVKKDKE